MSTNLNIGINESDRHEIAAGLSRLLADSYLLYLKTHNFHWNVTGPFFSTLHALFEEHYTELATAIDDIAERIRALGIYAPGSLSQYQELASIQEENGRPDAKHMVEQLVTDHEAVIQTARSVLPLADKADDEASLDLLTQRLHIHEKTAWILRSQLEN